MKKAQGLSMTYIILAAIGLIAFVVIIAIFSGNSMEASSTVNANKKCLCSDYVDGTTYISFKCASTQPSGDKWSEKTASAAGCEKFFDCPQKCYIQGK
ncbi:hypothetical protein K9M79_02795 [Candidatus Woesearchaeota archaeon]|nr:hypothetical protein [Candidatus Woesearchaeota archaeon]